ncbi:ADP-ribosylation [Xylaria longipes]|nr:ADP-ribosylation [Xylaria longipes]
MVHLMPLGCNDPVYREAEKRFRTGWKHPGITYHLEGIYYINQAGGAAQQHLVRNRAYLQQVQCHISWPAEQYLFHGTRRACHVGDDSCNLQPCNLDECNFCHILKCSFSLSHANANGMFGAGIYTSSISSKANGYVWNHHIHSQKHAMFLSNVVTGKSQKLYQATQGRTAPDNGYDSVEAVTRDHGGSVDYPETIVYQERAILPSVVVVYTRQ